jgi:hypothetical protein
MWPTAKIARAIVGDPPDRFEDPEVDRRRRVEVDPPQRGREHHRRDEGGPAGGVRGVAVGRGLARLDHHLAEPDDQEQAEALGEVVRVEGLRGVLWPQRRQVVVAAQPAGRRAVLGQHRARLDADRDGPQRVTQRLGRGRGEREQGRGPRQARVVRSLSRLRPSPVTA